MAVEKVYFMLRVADMERALVFYQKAFDLTVRFRSAEWSELAWRDATVALHGGGARQPTETGLGFSVDDLDAACEAVRRAGGQIVRAPQARPGEPIRLATAADPEGNRFSLTQPIQ